MPSNDEPLAKDHGKLAYQASALVALRRERDQFRVDLVDLDPGLPELCDQEAQGVSGGGCNPGVVFVLDQAGEDSDVVRPVRADDADLGEVAADGVDELGSGLID